MADVALNFSDLRDEIEFWVTTAIPNGSGGFTSTNALSFKMLAKVEPKGSNKLQSGATTIFEDLAYVWIRREEGFIPNEQMLVKYDSGTYRIISIENIQNRNKVLKIIIAKR
jgi:hypothetical protein